MKEIVQKRGVQRRSAEITDEGVRFEFQAPFGRHATTAPFETILSHPVEFTQGSDGPPIIEAVFLTTGLLFGFVGIRSEHPDLLFVSVLYAGACLAMGAVMTWSKRSSRQQLLQLSGGDVPLVLFYDARNRSEADRFAGSVQEATQRYLRREYGATSSMESKAVQIERLDALRERGAISPEEFASLKSELVSRTPTELPSGQYL